MGFYRKVVGGETVFAEHFGDEFRAHRLQMWSGATPAYDSGEGETPGALVGLEFWSPTGPIRVDIGDYIVRGPEGTFYPVKADAFAAGYEAIEEGAAPRMHRQSDGRYCFRCPGCGHAHCVPTTGPNAWEFNGDVDRPTLSPSILVTSGRDGGLRCHSFVRGGRIEYLSDCSHHLAGQTVDLLPWNGQVYERQES